MCYCRSVLHCITILLLGYYDTVPVIYPYVYTPVCGLLIDEYDLDWPVMVTDSTEAVQ